MTICPNCGAENPSESRWCGKCGNSIPNKNRFRLCLVLLFMYSLICLVQVLTQHILFQLNHFDSILKLARLIMSLLWLILLIVSKKPLKKYHKIFGIIFLVFNCGIFLLWSYSDFSRFIRFGIFPYDMLCWFIYGLLQLAISIMCVFLSFKFIRK